MRTGLSTVTVRPVPADERAFRRELYSLNGRC